jgi:hypothetical protein
VAVSHACAGYGTVVIAFRPVEEQIFTCAFGGDFFHDGVGFFIMGRSGDDDPVAGPDEVRPGPGDGPAEARGVDIDLAQPLDVLYGRVENNTFPVSLIKFKVVKRSDPDVQELLSLTLS